MFRLKGECRENSISLPHAFSVSVCYNGELPTEEEKGEDLSKKREGKLWDRGGRNGNRDRRKKGR